MITIHPPNACAGQACPFHNPSDHHMRLWKINVRLDKEALVERVCPTHGTGHPDPDSLDYLDRNGLTRLGTHGCCGCCTKPRAPLRDRLISGSDLLDPRKYITT